MITDKDTNAVYFSDLLLKQSVYSETLKQIIAALNLFGYQPRFIPNTKDIWARDYMPIQVSENSFIEYRYDPDYLQKAQKGFRDLKTYSDIACDSINLKTLKSEIIIDGGNVVKSRDCVIMTDKVVHENRQHLTQKQLVEQLRDTFQVDKVVLIPWDRLDVYGHSDGMLRFIDEQTVLINELYTCDRSLINQLKQNNLDCEFLRFNIRKKDKRNWAYINFLQTKDFILLPALGIEEDDVALEQLKQFYPEYERICKIDSSSIIKRGGALNCISWTKKE